MSSIAVYPIEYPNVRDVGVQIGQVVHRLTPEQVAELAAAIQDYRAIHPLPRRRRAR